MKMKHWLIALAMVCGLTGMAKAEAVGFQMVVIDPTYSGNYTINTITTTTFPFTFSECESPGQLPQGVSYDGCFTGQNETGGTITSLTVDIPLTAGPASCGFSTTVANLFSTVSCAPNSNNTDSVLTFSGGDVVEGELFTLAESGVDVTVTPIPQGSVVAAISPEPDSLLLLSTGVLSVGAFFHRRQRIFASATR
jgi:hypothetical protein